MSDSLKEAASTLSKMKENVEQYALLVYFGRMNLRLGPLTPNACLKIIPGFSSKKSLLEVLNDIRDKMSYWSDEYERDTQEAIETEEYWFKIEPYERDPELRNIDISLTPHERWLACKDRLDKDRILLAK